MAVAGTNLPLYFSTPDGLAEVRPTLERVQDLTDACGAGLEGRYPVARAMWLNARPLCVAAAVSTGPRLNARGSYI